MLTLALGLGSGCRDFFHGRKRGGFIIPKSQSAWVGVRGGGLLLGGRAGKAGSLQSRSFSNGLCACDSLSYN